MQYCKAIILQLKINKCRTNKETKKERKLEWIAIFFSRGSYVSCIDREILYH